MPAFLSHVKLTLSQPMGVPPPPPPPPTYTSSAISRTQILSSFSSDKDRRTDSGIRRKNSAAPPGIEHRVLQIPVARSNHWASKPQRELRVNSQLSPSCQFFFHYEVTRIARVYSTQRPAKTRWILIRSIEGMIPTRASWRSHEHLELPTWNFLTFLNELIVKRTIRVSTALHPPLVTKAMFKVDASFWKTHLSSFHAKAH